MPNDELISALAKSLVNEQLSLFVGAGLSIDAGMPSWKELLRPIAVELGLNVDKETELTTLAQFYVNHHSNNRGALNSHICTQFSGDYSPTPIHRLLAELPFSSYWTTNYDKLIENSLIEAKKHPHVIVFPTQISFLKQDSKAKVYKIHGDIDHPASIILTRDDYDTYFNKNPLFINILKTDLLSKTFIFLGFSFHDTNFRYTISQLKDLLGDHTKTHYWIELIPEKTDQETEDAYSYRINRLRYHIKDLERFNIKCILLKNKNELSDLLLKIKEKYQNLRMEGTVYEHIDAVPVPLKNTESNLVTLNSPIHGFFHESRGGAFSPLIYVGQFIEKDQEICLIYSNQRLCSVRSPIAGFVDAIFIKNEALIKAQQPIVSLNLAPGMKKERLYYQSCSVAGTFYRGENPDPHPPLIKVGDTIIRGQPLALLEMMKAYYYIKADISGTLLAIIPENGHTLDAMSTVFIIETNDKVAHLSSNKNIQQYKSPVEGVFTAANKESSKSRFELICFYGKHLTKGSSVGVIKMDSPTNRKAKEDLLINSPSDRLFINYLAGFGATVNVGTPLYSYLPTSAVGSSFTVITASTEGQLSLLVEENSTVQEQDTLGYIDSNISTPIISNRSGTIIEILIKNGAYVKYGDVILKLTLRDKT